MSGRDLYLAELAEQMKARAGEKYRPSNGHEGDLFEARFCTSCSKENYAEATGDGACDINMRALFYDIGDQCYPAEWQYSAAGQPICTAFCARSAKP